MAILNKTLSKVPSELIQQALDDLAAVEAMPDRYVVCMGDWHSMNPFNGCCSVCFAGAVMAMNGLPDDVDYTMIARHEIYESIEEEQAFNALNHFRCGLIFSGLRTLDIDVDKCMCVPHEVTVTRYSEDRAAFRHDMEQIIDLLKSIDL